MSKFVIKNIEAIKGRQQFKQLVIVSDEVNADNLQLQINLKEAKKENVEIMGILDLYENTLEKKYINSFYGIIAIMNRVANLQSVAANKFKDVTPDSEIIKEFEFKYQDLRVLAIKIPGGELVLVGGYKNQQKADFSRFHSLKKQYLAYLKKLNNEKIRPIKK
jgi:mannose/fructose/N-acetylgalactosamine-specific phosphotransferase system component IIB